MTPQLDAFTTAYIVCALWSSSDDEDDPLDSNYGIADIAPGAMEQIVADCAAFQKDNAEMLAKAYELYAPHADAPRKESSGGHDFWLTRNGHGAGFWDRGLGEIGDALTKAAHKAGEVDLYVGDDGLIYEA